MFRMWRVCLFYLIYLQILSLQNMKVNNTLHSMNLILLVRYRQCWSFKYVILWQSCGELQIYARLSKGGGSTQANSRGNIRTKLPVSQVNLQHFTSKHSLHVCIYTYMLVCVCKFGVHWGMDFVGYPYFLLKPIKPTDHLVSWLEVARCHSWNACLPLEEADKQSLPP